MFIYQLIISALRELSLGTRICSARFDASLLYRLRLTLSQAVGKRKVHDGLFAMSRLGLNRGVFPSVSACCRVSMMDLQFYFGGLVSRRINVIC
jgi:hypothetical protein